jgi:hypothetical protein
MTGPDEDLALAHRRRRTWHTVARVHMAATVGALAAGVVSIVLGDSYFTIAMFGVVAAFNVVSAALAQHLGGGKR